MDSHDKSSACGDDEKKLREITAIHLASLGRRERHSEMIKQCQSSNTSNECNNNPYVCSASRETFVHVKLGGVSHRVKEEPEGQSDAGGSDVLRRNGFQVRDNVKSDENRNQGRTDNPCKRERVTDQVTDSTFSE